MKFSQFDEDGSEAWEDMRDAQRALRSRSTACRCFAPGEAAGTCPGQENCPMCEEEESDA